MAEWKKTKRTKSKSKTRKAVNKAKKRTGKKRRQKQKKWVSTMAAVLLAILAVVTGAISEYEYFSEYEIFSKYEFLSKYETFLKDEYKKEFVLLEKVKEWMEEYSFAEAENGQGAGLAVSESKLEFDLKLVPEYKEQPYAVINHNIPFFTEEDMMDISFEQYSPLDELGRCGECFANVGKDIMPTEERGKIGHIKPSGWQLAKYDIVDGKYLYNRCHLIGYQLTGENANVENLITGTRYLNVEGMLPFENQIADYVEETGNHVLYRVTPIFEGDNLLASGVLMEARSVEDKGIGIEFCVFCYNVQPGIRINYANGESQVE